MIGAILQPTYLPWLGYFEMIATADIFVVYDHVQFVKKSWHHRNRIKGPNGEILLSVPTQKAPRETPICSTLLAQDYKTVLHNHWESIAHAYKKAPAFNHYSETLQTLFKADYTSLSDLTVSFIQYVCNQLDLCTPFIRSSSLALDTTLTDPTERVVDLCQKAHITTLYDANGAQNVIDSDIFKKHQVGICFQHYEHPTYTQQFGAFLPYMSILDLLLNEGDKSLAIIQSGRRDPYV